MTLIQVFFTGSNVQEIVKKKKVFVHLNLGKRL